LIYDALGRMVEQQNGSTYTQMLYSQAGKTAIMNGQTLTKAFVSLPGGGTAIYTASGLAYYRHADWLGSSRLTSTASRTVYSASAYAPFGEQYGTSGTADASFTGQNADTNSNLYDFTFREYSPSQGRWISPDPAGLGAVDPTTPQSWNRYAYVLNNPLGLVDPLGLDCVTANEDGTMSIEGGDCPDINPNNEYYVNCDDCLDDVTFGTISPTGLLVLAGQSQLGLEFYSVSSFGYTAPDDSSGPDPAANNGPQQYDPGTFLHPSKQACGRINKFAKVELGVAATSAAGGLLFPPAAIVTEPVAAATGLFGGGLEIYMAFACE
jgi:RHS repeat-associated protein